MTTVGFVLNSAVAMMLRVAKSIHAKVTSHEHHVLIKSIPSNLRTA